jgi:hypothetical protein
MQISFKNPLYAKDKREPHKADKKRLNEIALEIGFDTRITCTFRHKRVPFSLPLTIPNT